MLASLRTKVFGLVAGLGFIAALPAQPPDRPRPDPAEQQAAMRSVLEKRTALQDRGQREIPYLVFFLEFWDKADCAKACAAFQEPIHVFDRFDEFATVLVKLQSDDRDTDRAIDKILSSAGLRWFDEIGVVGIPPPRAEQFTIRDRREPEQVVHGGLKGLTGAGVIIAVIDSGIDFRHPDFVAPDGTSRILYYWDTLTTHRTGQGQPGPRAYFEGGPKIGTLYTRDDLNRYLQSGNPNDGPADEGGHGTGCAGVAAGNGAVWRQAVNAKPELRKQDCRGVAPEADLIAVRIGRATGLANAWLLNAIVDWLDKEAAKVNKPLVISCSFGGQDGGHDASLIEERQLARRLPPTKPGRAICIAAGNEATDGIHVMERFSKNQPAKISWQSRSRKSSDGRYPESMQIFIDGAGKEDVTVTLAEGAEGKAFKPYVHGISNARVQIVGAAGSGSLTISTTSDKQLRADVYFFTREDDEGPMGRLVNAINGNQIGTPATTPSALSIGSYDFNDQLYEPDDQWYGYKSATGEKIVYGAISGYSNAGYLRSTGGGRPVIKPDVVAPGQWHVAPAAPVSVQRWEQRKAGLDATRRYCLFNGTSAATPYTAGVIALLMQKNARLSADDFRALLRQYAFSDAATGATPNPKWGYGKLNKTAIERIVDAWK